MEQAITSPQITLRSFTFKDFSMEPMLEDVVNKQLIGIADEPGRDSNQAPSEYKSRRYFYTCLVVGASNSVAKGITDSQEPFSSQFCLEFLEAAGIARSTLA
jgi:hypothetical protein